MINTSAETLTVNPRALIDKAKNPFLAVKAVSATAAGVAVGILGGLVTWTIVEDIDNYMNCSSRAKKAYDDYINFSNESNYGNEGKD